MELSKLTAARGSVKRKKEIGRGEGSGHGKTCCKGHKGQKARSGGTVARGKEGGQMPLYRRLPKKGFNHKRFNEEILVINVDQLNVFDDGAKVTPDELFLRRIVDKRNVKVKVLGDGELQKKLNVEAGGFSTLAKTKIEGKKGTWKVV